MEYLELIKRFWNLHNTHFFGTNEIALFFYLLEQRDIIRAKESFRQNNRKIMAELNISFHTLQNTRNRLKQAGIINFYTCTGKPITIYFFVSKNSTTFANFAEVSAEVSTEVSAEVSTEVAKENTPTPLKENNNINNPPLTLKGCPPKREGSGASTAKPTKRNSFVKPSIEEIQTYIQEKGLNIDAEKFYWHYEANGWYCGKGKKMVSWKGALQTWQRSEFNKPQKTAAITLNQKSMDYEGF